MNFIFDFVPIICSSFAAILAVWGDCTYRDANNHLKGLRPRGWWSVAALSIALALSVGSQVHNQKVDLERQEEIKRLRKEAAETKMGVKQVSTDVSMVSTRMEDVSSGVSGVRSGVDEISHKVDEVSKELIRSRDLVRLGTLMGYAQSKGEIVISPGDPLDDPALYREVRGERVYDMNKVRAEIERLKKKTEYIGTGEASPITQPSGSR